MIWFIDTSLRLQSIITAHILNSFWTTSVWRISHYSWTDLYSSRIECESYVTTDSQSASLSWNKAPIWGLRPDFYYRQTVAGLLIWGALSHERTGLSFTIAAGPSQRSHSRVRAPWDSQPYFPVSDLRLPWSWLTLSLSLMLRPTVSRPVYLGINHPSGAYDQIFINRRTVAGLLMWGALSDGRTGLSFTIAAGPSQRSHSRVRAPWDSRPYFTVSDLRLPSSSPPTTRRVTVEVFDPALPFITATRPG
jgi:hypothetical protein